MLVEVTFGRTVDANPVRQAWEEHTEALRSTDGWLGGVAGVTDDARVVAVARSKFGPPHPLVASLAPHLQGPPEVLQADGLVVVHEDRPWEAGFVQVMRARVRSRARLEEVEARIGQAFLDHRPDVLATYRTWPREDLVIAVDHFTSEEEARAGEQREPPPELREAFQEWLALLEEISWFDLTNPWLAPP